MTEHPTLRQSGAGPRAAADRLHGLARAMIRQARILKADGSHADARALAGRARALDQLGWSYLPRTAHEPRPRRAALH
jgi:hypothetical protein